MSRFKFRKVDTIGAVAAEEDTEFLKHCFVDTGDLDVLRNCSDPRRFVVGRVGSGKSALLHQLAELEEHVIQIAPDNLALGYVSNSDILTYVAGLGVSLDLFFRLLWRHVLSVEILRHRFEIYSEKSKYKIVDWIHRQLRPEKHQRALDYLNRWGGAFWENTDIRIKELTTKVEAEIDASLKTAGLGGLGSKLVSTEEEKREVVHRAQHVINQVQISELAEIINLVNVILDDPQQRYFVVIDRLDENWIEDRLRYQLIRALLETAKEFHRVQNAKVIVALRIDLIDRVFRLTRDVGFQEEKYEGDYLPLRWSPNQLVEVLDRRITHLVRERYTKATVTHKEILPKKVGPQPALEYMLERTLMRPRDIIMFVNGCIAQATNCAGVTVSMVRQAEGEYSRNRLRSLADEWRGDYPNLLWCVELLKRRPDCFRFDAVAIDQVADFCLAGVIAGFEQSDQISEAATKVVNGELNARIFWAEAVEMFYRVGVAGLKMNPFEPVLWSTEGRRSVSSAEIGPDTKVSIHPVFWRVLGVQAQRNRVGSSVTGEGA